MAAKKSQKPQKTAPPPAATQQTIIALKPKKEKEQVQESDPIVTSPPTPVSSPAPDSGSVKAKKLKKDLVIEPESSFEVASQRAPVSSPASDSGLAKAKKPDKDLVIVPDSLESPPVAAAVPPARESDSSEVQINAFFQAVGIIVGDVHFNSEGKGFIAIGQKSYRLFYASYHKRSYDILRREIEKTNNHRQRLLVYPRVTHFPSREEPYIISFLLVGFESEQQNFLFNKDLSDFEFKLSGLWQFIPVCKTPCLSIFKNFSPARLTYIKEATVELKVNFMKASHIPVIWRDATVKPFRFNPKLDKEQQGQAKFVGIKAQFLPEKDVFSFSELSILPSMPPRFLKAGKRDKAQVIKSQRERSGKKVNGGQPGATD